ncbi:uncharacterized protein LOC114646013 [Erpetoichthys calabaricus]|uniref:uncharacterized protein LOC114646013 n=1 Tax=Erpetoichthys calabaricus TaxID=27687 RepID=UPI00109EE39C|nr:uncharacterized protein LOC114646013 [Erpetoichthys calabaricus]
MDTTVPRVLKSYLCETQMKMNTSLSPTTYNNRCEEELDIDAGVPDNVHRKEEGEIDENNSSTLENHGCKELFFPKEFKTIEELKDLDLKCHMWVKYLLKKKNPLLPKVKLTISKLIHATSKKGVTGILQNGGFKGELFNENLKCGPFSFWTGAADSQETTNQIRSWLQKNTKNLSMLSPEYFKTSPAFSESSLYGNYKFTLDFADVLEAYKTQCCEGKDPVFRVFGTSCFKAEIMYTVIVHSPEEFQFNEFPCLPNSKNADVKICTQDNNSIFWYPESMSRVNKYNLYGYTDFLEYYVWDHLVFALHITDYLKFPKEYLLKQLSACELQTVNVCRDPENIDIVQRYIDELKSEQPQNDKDVGVTHEIA